MSSDDPKYRIGDFGDELLKKGEAVERAADKFVELLRDLADRPVRAPRTPGRITWLVFVKLACRRVRVEIGDGRSLDMHQTLAFALMALARPGGVRRDDGREYKLPEAIAAEIGRLRGTPPPSRQAVATYVARLRKELASVRTDGKDLILGSMSGGWRLALDEKATVRFP